MTNRKPDSRRAVALISPYGIENRGVRYISAVLRQKGFTPHLILFKRWINNQISEPTDREVEILTNHLKQIDPLMVGIGFGAPYFKLVTDLTRRIRDAVDTTILWGGVHPTVCPDECIEHADVVCVGEGEYPALDLCQALAEGGDIRHIPNLWVRDGGEVVRNEPRELIADLDELPEPDYCRPGTCFIEDDRFLEEDPITGTVEYRIYPTRGCPYACTYCHNSVLRGILKGKGRYYRVRSVSSVISELERALETFPRIRRVKFDGDVFAFPAEWLRDFSREYKKRIDIPFEILTYPGELSEEALSLLKEAGLQKLQTGIQSGSDDEVQTVFGRRSTGNDIRELLRIAHRVGVEVVFDLIFDDPLATETDKRAMVELLLDLERPFKVYLYSLTVFPRTALAKELLERGVITEDQVEGRATKSFRQFRLSLDYPRSAEDRFWICLSILSAKSFIPKGLIRRLMKSQWLRRHPGPVQGFTELADLIKVGMIAFRMLLDGEMTLFKIRQYGSFRRKISQ